MAINIFDNPQFYRKQMLARKLVYSSVNKFLGKSFICVFFTRFCSVSCPFCFFKSASFSKKKSIEDQFSDIGNASFIKWANAANPGYLQISGGGEPFHLKKYLLECIEKIQADRIILVTSGSWAVNRKIAEKYVDDIALTIKKRKKNARVTIRLSVSENHSIKLGMNPIRNLIKLFEAKYRNDLNFTLQLKSFDEDKMLEKSLKSFTEFKLELIEVNGSDDTMIKKVIPRKYLLTIPSGYQLIVGVSKVFESGLRPNLNDYNSIEKAIEVYDQDLEHSEDYNSSVVFNKGGKRGLDWIVEYNGNVCTWQNRVQDNLFNIYEDDFHSVANETFKDLLTLSYIEKGSKYRETIIKEISPKTLNLMKAVGIRDYAGTLLFEDEKIRLYYVIRILQDYIKENRVVKKELKKLSKELLKVIYSSKEEIIKLYQSAKYCVVDQEIKRFSSLQCLQDFLEKVKLGHYELSSDQIMKAINFYNLMASSDEQVGSIDEIPFQRDLQVERRLTQRVMKLKPTIVSNV